MAEEKNPVADGLKKSDIIKSQAKYKGNSHADLEKITIIADGSFYKKGQTDKVHPATANILRKKELVK